MNRDVAVVSDVQEESEIRIFRIRGIPDLKFLLEMAGLALKKALNAKSIQPLGVLTIVDFLYDFHLPLMYTPIEKFL